MQFYFFLSCILFPSLIVLAKVYSAILNRIVESQHPYFGTNFRRESI